MQGSGSTPVHVNTALIITLSPQFASVDVQAGTRLAVAAGSLLYFAKTGLGHDDNNAPLLLTSGGLT